MEQDQQHANCILFDSTANPNGDGLGLRLAA